jgi:Mg-chelatase subunit ChlD
MRRRLDQQQRRRRGALVLALALGLGLAPAPPAPARAADAPPVDAVFVIDNSGSMRRNDPQFTTRRVVREFADALADRGADSRLGMVVFDRDARLALPLSPLDAGATRGRLEKSLARVDFRGQLTDSADGIERALYELRTRGRPDASRIVVFLTDGLIDTGDPRTDRESGRWLRETLAQAAAREKIRIFGIAFTESADVELIQTLALETGGEYYRAYRAEEIPAVTGEILERVGRAGTTSPETAATPAALAGSSGASGGRSPPPVSAASAGRRLPTLAWAALGALLLAAGLTVAALRSRERETPAVAPASPPAPAPPSAAPGRVPAKLLDIMRASPQGVLPLSMERDRLSVGRDDTNDIVIPRDTVSSFHATLDHREGYYYVEDHRSTNGTRLNGAVLAANEPARLKSGDRIDFADYEFRFLIPDRLPSGKTVLLGGSRLSPETTQGPGADEPLAPPGPGEGDEGALFRRCLESHLERISDLGDRYAGFVESSFPPECVERLTSHVERLMKFGAADRKGRTETFAEGEVMYVLCVVPHSMRGAAAWFGEHYGGFTKLLGRWLDAPEFQRSNANVLCVVTYGRSRDAWVSVTIAPGDDCREPIDIMSVELLSAEERRALALHFDEIGQVL